MADLLAYLRVVQMAATMVNWTDVQTAVTKENYLGCLTECYNGRR